MRTSLYAEVDTPKLVLYSTLSHLCEVFVLYSTLRIVIGQKLFI